MRKVFFRQGADAAEIAVTEDGVLQHYYRLQNGFLTGAIAVGKVRFVKKQTGVFVDLGLDKDGLLSYRDGLKAGDLVLVQVTREPTPEKGCALTEKLTLAGRFVVLNDVGEYKFSHKLPEEVKVKLTNPPTKAGIGFVFRSSCRYADVRDVYAECETLIKAYDEISEKARHTQNVSFLRKDDARDVAYRFAYSDDERSDDFSEVEREVRALGERKAETHGVELVFDKTEAMTVVDVNMHRYQGGEKDPETAAFRANLLAVKELARQLRLRNQGGIILVDFISLKREEDMTALRDALVTELKKDNVQTSVELVKSIGMFAIVRKQRFSPL